jgi:mannose/cellobiose epimerase-like protein (N-acyl-D-glucosamine 2-epimerase family)
MMAPARPRTRRELERLMSQPDAFDHAAGLRDQLKTWALEQALPLWWATGADHQRGGFFEKIDQTGRPVEAPKRARVAARQIYVYAAAKALGWQGPWRQAVEHGLSFFLDHFRRPDGLVRALVGPEGGPLDDSVMLYDQAFALFSLAMARQALPERGDLLDIAVALRGAVTGALRAEAGGFRPDLSDDAPLQSNPHMHLFEACLAWIEAGGDPVWRQLADEIAELALSRFIQPETGALREFFAHDWAPAPGIEGRIVEPGHQFEWAWLLLRWNAMTGRPEARAAALRLIEIGDGPGVDPARGVAYFALLDDMSVHDSVARLWPQTERIKAGVLAARMTGEDRWWAVAAAGAEGLLKYLDVPVAGLWLDRLQADGVFVDEPAPASSFYHIICGVLEMDIAVRAATGNRRLTIGPSTQLG